MTFEDRLWAELEQRELERARLVDVALEICGELRKLLAAARFEIALLRLRSTTPQEDISQ